MKILVRRTGGFAGLAETLYDVDTSTLAASAASELERKLSSLEAAVRSQGAAPPRAGADFFNYEISITDQQGERSLTVADDGGAASQLINEILNELSRIGQR
jgi:Emfourin